MFNTWGEIMLELAAAVFAITAIGGVLLAFIRFSKNVNPPTLVALTHGSAGGIGLVLLLIGVLQTGEFGYPGLALILFLVAAAGGFYLFTHHMREQLIPSQVVALHGGIAVVAFGALLASLFLV